MEQVEVTEVAVLNPKGWFLEPIRLRVQFKVNHPLQKGSAESYVHDQLLDHFFMELTSKGTRTFEIEADPPDASKIPSVEDLIGASVFMVCAFYRSQEFFRYFVYNKFVEGEVYQKGVNKEYNDVRRQILHDNCVILRKEIVWDTDLCLSLPKKKVKKK